MSYNFLGLVNEVNRRVNEVELTSSNFPTAMGFYSTAKDAVNTAIRHINQEDYYWPFNYIEQEDSLSAGTMRYALPNNAKITDFNTFRIKRSSVYGNATTRLMMMDYEEYLDKFVDDEYNTDTSIRGLPKRIIRTPSQEYVVHPSPDNAYDLVYEYYSLPVDLSLYSDVPTIPEFARNVIIDGAMYYVFTFRGDVENADRSNLKFTKGIDHLRSIYTNRYEYLRDTRVDNNYGYIQGPRVG